MSDDTIAAVTARQAHKIKIWPEAFSAIVSEDKKFIIRKNDRDFNIGDELTICEWTPCSTCGGTGREQYDAWDRATCSLCNGDKSVFGYSGREASVKVTYIEIGKEFEPRPFGIPSSMCAIGISLTAWNKWKSEK